MSLFSFLTTLEIRQELQAALKEKRRIAIELESDLLPIDVVKVGWGTVTYDLYDEDESTWLARHTLPILDIDGINHAHVHRTRCQLVGLEDEGLFDQEHRGSASAEVEFEPEDDE